MLRSLFSRRYPGSKSQFPCPAGRWVKLGGKQFFPRNLWELLINADIILGIHTNSLCPHCHKKPQHHTGHGQCYTLRAPALPPYQHAEARRIGKQQAKHKVNTHFFYHAISKQRQPHLVDGRVDPSRQQCRAPKARTQQNILQVRSAFPTAQRLLCLVFLPCNQACININCHL